MALHKLIQTIPQNERTFENFQYIINQMCVNNPGLFIFDTYGDLFQISRSTVPYEINMLDNSMLMDLINECYSVIMEQRTLNIVYTFYDSYTTLSGYNCTDFISNINGSNVQIIEAFDGPYIGIYKYKTEWYISTQHNIMAPMNIMEALVDTLGTFKYTTNEFLNGLKPDLQYQFVLLCHSLQNMLDYSFEFGPKYHKLIHVKTLKDCVELNLHMQLISPIFHFEDKKMLTNLYYAARVSSLSVLDTIHDDTSKLKQIKGLHVKITHMDTNRSVYYFFPSVHYYKQLNEQTHKTLILDHTIVLRLSHAHIDSFVEWYRRDKLDEYFRLYPQYYLIECNNETTDLITLVDTFFKIMASEVMELFKLLYNFTSRKFQSFLPATTNTNIDLYTILCSKYPQYTKIIHLIKSYIDTQKCNGTNYILHIKDIYNILKNNRALNYKSMLEMCNERKSLFEYLNELNIGPHYLSKKCKPDNLEKFQMFATLLHKLS